MLHEMKYMFDTALNMGSTDNKRVRQQSQEMRQIKADKKRHDSNHLLRGAEQQHAI